MCCTFFVFLFVFFYCLSTSGDVRLASMCEKKRLPREGYAGSVSGLGQEVRWLSGQKAGTHSGLFDQAMS